MSARMSGGDGGVPISTMSARGAAAARCALPYLLAGAPPPPLRAAAPALAQGRARRAPRPPRARRAYAACARRAPRSSAAAAPPAPALLL